MNYIIGCKFVILRNQSTIMIISFQIIDNSTVCSTARNYCPFVRAIRWRPAGSPSQGDNNTEIASMSKRFYDMTASIFLDPLLSACVITWLCTDSPLPDCYIVLLITPKHPTHSNTGTVTVAELSCTHSFPHNDPMHGFGDECVQYYSQPQSCTHV